MVDRDGRIVLANALIERLFDYRRDELLGKSVDLLVPERLRARHPGHRGSFVANPAPRAMGVGRDLFGLRKDGREFPIEIGLSPLNTDEGTFVLASVIASPELRAALGKGARKVYERNFSLHGFAEKLHAALGLEPAATTKVR